MGDIENMMAEEAEAAHRAALATQPSAPDMATLLGDHYAAAIKGAIERSVALSMALGIPEAIAQEAIERALVIVSVGTFQNRVARKTGAPASVKAACREMAAMVETKPPRAERRNQIKH